MTGPLAGTPWNAPSTVQGFVRAQPNAVLIEYAARRRAAGGVRALDIGCGAGRNAVPLARKGWWVLGTDLSQPMLIAARDRARVEPLPGAVHLAMAPMQTLPVRSSSIDLIVAHGIWNLAHTTREFRAAVQEAARVAAADARLFVFTFSRHTLPPGAEPLPGEPFVFTQFAGQPQVFLTEAQLLDELGAAGFERDDTVPLTEYNRPPAGQRLGGGPVIYEAAFRAVRRGA
jgi:SAM-dependent methyltransferase